MTEQQNDGQAENSVPPKTPFCGGITRNWMQARLTGYPHHNMQIKTLFIYKKYFFSIKLLHAHLRYVYNIPTLYLKDKLKLYEAI